MTQHPHISKQTRRDCHDTWLCRKWQASRVLPILHSGHSLALTHARREEERGRRTSRLRLKEEARKILDPHCQTNKLSFINLLPNIIYKLNNNTKTWADQLERLLWLPREANREQTKLIWSERAGSGKRDIKMTGDRYSLSHTHTPQDR